MRLLMLVIVIVAALASALPAARADGGQIYLPIIHTVGSDFRRVNAPFFQGDVRFSETAVFWFGRVALTENYADVRVGYNAEELWVHAVIIDRRLWWDDTPPVTNITAWDAVTLLLDLDASAALAPGQNSYRFQAQLTQWGTRAGYQAADRGNGSAWVQSSVPFTTTAGWRGDSTNNDIDDKGWVLTWEIPFKELGLPGPPHDAVWGLGIQVHDRDDAGGTPITEKVWPEGLSPSQPGTWAELHFGVPGYSPSPRPVAGTVIVRHGLSGAIVQDAGVGGHSTCGGSTDYWSQWGDTNEGFYNPERDQANVMNQADVADYPCFSKFYLSFPLSAIPAGKAIISATLTLHQFGSAGDGAQSWPEFIQVHTVRKPWDDLTITWNNAPPAVENFGGRWVDPWTEPQIIWPGRRWDWDVSRAVSSAYGRDDWLRIALYSSDAAMHSGKYFTTSNIGDWDAVGRPTLTIAWANP